jgi:UDP-N-acetylmuramate--alanine ligase
MISVVTNIDFDHMGTYEHDFERLKNTFKEFLHRLPFYGLAVACIDDPIVRELLPSISRPILTYGFSEDAAIRISSYTHSGMQTQFVVERPKGLPPLPVTLNLPGRHNVLNALAAVAVATELNIQDNLISEALLHFAGIGRRFQIYGDYPTTDGGKVTLVDDYGHHPREIAATLQAARESWPDRRLVMVYQPHRYTRTRDLFRDFCEVLATPDKLFLLDVYSAGETFINGADSQSLLQEINTLGTKSAQLIPDQLSLPAMLEGELKDGDILLMQGAGNIGSLSACLAASQLKQAVTVKT